MKSGLCTVYPTTNLVHRPPPNMDMIAHNDYFPAGDPQGDHPTFPFERQTTASQWWDDLGLIPSHPKVPPLHHIPDITVPTLHQMCGMSWYRGLADAPPPLSPPNPLCAPPLCPTPPPPRYATPSPSLLPDRAAPPMAINFVDGLGIWSTGTFWAPMIARRLGDGWRKFRAGGGGG